MTDKEYSRLQRFPDIVDRTIAKLRALENEARRYSDTTLLSRLEAANAAWDHAIVNAQADAIEHGGSIGFGELRRGVTSSEA